MTALIPALAAARLGPGFGGPALILGLYCLRLALFKYQYNIYLALVKFQMIFARDMVHIVN